MLSSENRSVSVRFLSAALLGMSILSIMGCDSEESSDSAPPDHIINLPMSQGKYRYGVTDTIVVDFSERIDTAALAVSFASPEGIGSRFKSQTRLLIFGTTVSSGTPHFKIKSDFTATLSGLKDVAGNGRTAIIESFQPYNWADRDFVDANYTGYDSLFAADSGLWIDGSSMTDSLITEGRLDFNSNTGKEDRQDFKLFRMIPTDTLKLTLTCPKNVNMLVQWAGPFVPSTLDSVFKEFKFNLNSFRADSTRNKGTLTYSFNAEFEKHFDVLGSPAAVGIYIVRLSIPADTEAFYRLRLRQAKRKK